MTYSYQTDTGRTVAFVNKAAYDAATYWYGSTPKSELLDDYADHMDDGAIWVDTDTGITLTDDWADLCMAAWARDNCGRAAYVWAEGRP